MYELLYQLGILLNSVTATIATATATMATVTTIMATATTVTTVATAITAITFTTATAIQSTDLVIQKAQQSTQKARVRMVEKYLKKHDIQHFDIGDIVSIKVPREDRTATDNRWLFGRILDEPYSHRYKVITQSGIINRLMPTKDLGLGRYLQANELGYHASVKVSVVLKGVVVLRKAKIVLYTVIKMSMIVEGYQG
ncbi:hypothetical protein B7463_g409, partial [Scytalidium lignicola]